MKQGFTHYYYLISCPPDIVEEIDVIQRIIEELNTTMGESNGINIKCSYWKTNTVSMSQNSAQSIMNEQLLDSTDGLITILWTKFGPISSYGSGSEEEIEKMINQGKRVMLYFSNKPIAPKDINLPQYNRIVEFRNKHKKLFHEYNSINKFEAHFRRSMETIFINLSKEAKRIKKAAPVNHASAEVEMISENFNFLQFFDLGWLLCDFRWNTVKMDEYFSGPLKSIYDFFIAELKIFKPIDEDSITYLMRFGEKVSVDGFQDVPRKIQDEVRSLMDESGAELEKRLEGNELVTFQMGKYLGQVVALLNLAMVHDGMAKLKNMNKLALSEKEKQFMKEMQLNHATLIVLIEQAMESAKIVNEKIYEVLTFYHMRMQDGELFCDIAKRLTKTTFNKVASLIPFIR